MNIDFRQLTYKEFYGLINKIITNTFNVIIDVKNSREYYLQLKWYCSFISYFIKKNKMLHLEDFEETVTKNKYFIDDAETTLKCFNNIKLALLDKYTFINIEDIRNFCNKIETEIKV